MYFKYFSFWAFFSLFLSVDLDFSSFFSLIYSFYFSIIFFYFLAMIFNSFSFCSSAFYSLWSLAFVKTSSIIILNLLFVRLCPLFITWMCLIPLWNFCRFVNGFSSKILKSQSGMEYISTNYSASCIANLRPLIWFLYSTKND